jgi:hypothetical protein
MNQTEKRYLAKRIYQIGNRKQAEASKRINKQAIKEMSGKEMAAIIDKRFNTRTPRARRQALQRIMGTYVPHRDHGYRSSFSDYWSWPAEAKAREHNLKLRTEIDRIFKLIEHRAQDIEDHIMLGDSDTALAMLEAFRAESF